VLLTGSGGDHEQRLQDASRVVRLDVHIRHHVKTGQANRGGPSCVLLRRACLDYRADARL
jgi:hypothetical protein